MLHAERSSLFKFLALYGISTTLFLAILSSMYYSSQRQQIFSDKLQSMQVYADKVEASVYNVKKVSEIDEYYSEDPRYDIAIYDDKLRLIFGNFNAPIDWKINFYTKDEYIYFIDKMDSKYLKAHYVVVRGKNLEDVLSDVKSRLYATISIAFVFILLMAYFLAKVFLRPLRDAIAKMDGFIKDTTHELNTPLSAILMSIETINTNKLDAITQKKLNRISVASKTINLLYQSLSYSAMQGKMQNRLESLDIKEIIEERVDYFEPIAAAKNVEIVANLWSTFINIDRLKIQLIVDNLLSNAIKYNKKNAKVYIDLNQEYLSIKDEGVGIGTDKINEIFARYTRFDSATGGFGLGLSIVKSICDEYKIKIIVESKPNEGALFKLVW